MRRLFLSLSGVLCLSGCAQIASLTGTLPDEAKIPALIPLDQINAAANAPSAAQRAGEALANQAAELRARANRL